LGIVGQIVKVLKNYVPIKVDVAKCANDVIDILGIEFKGNFNYLRRLARLGLCASTKLGLDNAEPEPPPVLAEILLAPEAVRVALCSIV